MPLMGFHLAHTIPERTGDAVIARRKLSDVVDQLVGMVILRRHATGPRLQAHVDVLRDEYHRHPGALFAQLDHLIDDLVVVQVLWQRAGFTALAHQNRKAAARPAFAALDRHTQLDFLGRGIAQQPVDQTNRLAALGGHAVLTGLELIELLQHGHGYRDLVLLEIQQGIGIVD